MIGKTDSIDYFSKNLLIISIIKKIIMTKRHIFILLYIIAASLCLSYSTDAQSISSQDIVQTIRKEAEILAADPAFSQASVGICVRNADGSDIASVNAGKMLIPASNMKLITTGAALEHFGPQRKFKTTIAYDGTISDGILKGNLYIIGGGDPTLGSKDSIASPLERTFSQWYKALTNTGIKEIEGRIIGDGRWFDGPAEEQSWLWEDLGTYYGTGTCGLMFYENMMSFTVSARQFVGEPVIIRPYYPQTQWMDIRYKCSTGEKGTGDKLYMFTSDIAPVAEIRGTFGIDKGKKRVDCSNKFPEYTCAKYFADFLAQRGIDCYGGAADFKLKNDWLESHTSSPLTVIAETFSPELSRIIFETNHISNNVFAETLLRQLGKDINASADYPQSIDALEDVLGKELGLDLSRGIYIKDGSGLSRGNLVSPDFLCRFLQAMMHTEDFEEFLHGLPKPGGHGSLYFNMRKYADSVKDRIRLKSGSMNGVRCYSGYIIPASGCIEDSIIISVMVNNCTTPNWKILPLIDSFLAKVAASH